MYNPAMNNKLNTSWSKPVVIELGDAKDLIKEAKFTGFSDGVTFQGNPIGDSS